MIGTWAELVRSVEPMWQSTNTTASNQGMFTRAAMEQVQRWQQARANEWELAVMRVLGLPQQRKWPEALDLPRGA